ncbi:FKBP-type peptidyl-prolyl cis-trans isomerase [Streptomyces sp. NPDC007355]|uniref:FKBP-type peptidyl-prolyl cis-trans isomerase n=1 Tax=Streptomyces sp. NPDC007355 TaxID=3364778 RepID=UPI0036CB6D01
MTAGNGRSIDRGDYVKFHITSQVWGQKRNVSTYGKGMAPQVLKLGSPSTPPVLLKAVTGKATGSRVLVTDEAEHAFGKQMPPGVKKTDVAVFVIDLLESVSVDKNITNRGKELPPPANFPKIKDATGSDPEVEFPDKYIPSSTLEHATVVQGSGPEVKSGQTLIAQSLGVALSKRHKFQNTWDADEPGLYPLGSGMLIKGWERALVGKRVGDRVVFSVPADMAYGENPPPNSGIEKNESLLFVVEILGAV